ncbi:MAG: hypothetical protein PHI29_06880 [Gallionella sp.]|nr:hypothetical protein [Gallionella sp.]
MNDSPKLQWSDVWLLQAIVLCGRNGAGSLQDIVATGDYINHSIFTYEEISSGLFRLTAARLVAEVDSTFVPTTEALRGYEAAEILGGGIYEVWARLAKNYGVERPAGQHQSVGPDHEYSGISRESFAAAVSAWNDEAAAFMARNEAK